MIGSNIESLDKLDRKIVSSLLSNGRESIANLSRHIGLSRTAIAERINRLERTGIIKGYTAQIRLDNDEPQTACFLLIMCGKGQKTNVCEYLKGIPEIKLSSIVGGSFDIIALMEASSLHKIHMLCDEIENIPGIDQLKTTVVLHQPINR